MPDSSRRSPVPNYGLDAPGVVRNLFIVSGAGLLTWLTVATHIWSGMLALGPFRFRLDPMCLSAGLASGFMGAWMAWDSRYGKLRERERLLDSLVWTGRERVLDVGCGRGLLLVGAARRLTTGSAAGIDLWQAEDLSGNRPEATLENARLEGVAERIEVHTADMRKLPFPDGSFDTVLSLNAIHNVYSKSGRVAALAEIARVLKPGGTVLLSDIRHIREYAAALRAGGCTDVRNAAADFGTILLRILTLGAVWPGTLIARKGAQAGHAGA